jgi:hypothetical protein
MTFYDDCAKMCEDFTPNFGDKNCLLHHENAPCHFHFHQRIFWPKPVRFSSPTYLIFFVSPIEDKTERPQFWHSWSDWGKVTFWSNGNKSPRNYGCIFSTSTHSICLPVSCIEGTVQFYFTSELPKDVLTGSAVYQTFGNRFHQIVENPCGDINIWHFFQSFFLWKSSTNFTLWRRIYGNNLSKISKKLLNIIKPILEVIYRHAFYLIQHVSENGFCLRLQLEVTQFGLEDRASLHLRTQRQAETESNSVSWVPLIMFHQNTETEFVRSGDIMCFLWDMNKPTKLSWVLNKRKDDV